jgi:hypothetical protein
MEESMDLEDSRVAAFSQKSSKRASPEPAVNSETVVDADSIHQSKRRKRTPKKVAVSASSTLPPGAINQNTKDRGKFPNF